MNTQENQNYQGEQQSVCPACGYCAACGRRNAQPQFVPCAPSYPYYHYYQPSYTWVVNPTPITTSGTGSLGNATAIATYTT